MSGSRSSSGGGAGNLRTGSGIGLVGIVDLTGCSWSADCRFAAQQVANLRQEKTVRGQEKQCNNALLAMLKSMPKMPEKRRAYS
jgi:hypothetical protein